MSNSLPVTAAHIQKPAGSGNLEYVTVHLDESGATDYPFFLSSSSRSSQTFAVSIGIHAVTLIAVALLTTILPALSFDSSEQPEAPRTIGLVWLSQEGPGGGGGGGGNKSPDPPRKVEAPGKDAFTLPAERKPTYQSAPPVEIPDTIETLDVPAMAMASGIEAIPGALDGISGQTTSQGSGSGGGAGTGTGTGIGDGEGSGFGPGRGGGTGGGVYRLGAGITPPRVIREVKPQYTPEAMRAKVQGQVMLDVVVLPGGDVGRVEVIRSLDSVFGLDQEAIKAVRLWRFTPALRMGEPVSVLVTIELTFNLR